MMFFYPGTVDMSISPFSVRVITCPKCNGIVVMPVKMTKDGMIFSCLICGHQFNGAGTVDQPGSDPGSIKDHVSGKILENEPGWLKTNGAWQRLVLLFATCGLEHPFIIVETRGKIDFLDMYIEVPEPVKVMFSNGLKEFTIEEIDGFMRIRAGIT
jgi:hypothetical protein